jgi:integrase/recombinase XerD
VNPGITMADAVTALVAEKHAVGYKYAAEERVLARFAAFCRVSSPGWTRPARPRSRRGSRPPRSGQ